MNIVILILAIASLAISVVALILAKRNERVKEVVKETKVVTEHPFAYDEKRGIYVLDGGLEAKGEVTALHRNTKED